MVSSSLELVKREDAKCQSHIPPVPELEVVKKALEQRQPPVEVWAVWKGWRSAL